jgi:hypothetical protein
MVAYIQPSDWKQNQIRQLQQSSGMLNYADQMGNYITQPDPEFDYLSKAEDLAFRADALRKSTLNQLMTNSQISLGNQARRAGVNAPIPEGAFQQFVQAIKKQESGGNYGAVNPDSGAAGAYQIMPSNFVGQGGWDQEAIGRDVNLQAFLNHPRMQNRIAKYHLQRLFNQHGAAGAASAWYSGDPNLWNNRDSQGNYPSIHQYVLDILRMMGRG